MTVRPARPEDAQALAQVHVTSWQACYRGLLPDTLLAAQSIPHRARQWTAWLTEPDAPRGIFVAEDAPGVLAGFVACGPAREAPASGEVYAIYLRPDLFGRGWGRPLLETATAWLTARGYPEALLWVLESNARARRFYAAAGWAPDGAAKDEVQGDAILHEVRYRRAL